MINLPAQHVRSVNPRSSAHATPRAVRIPFSLLAFAICLFAVASPAQSTYRIASASPASIPAGAAGAMITLSGTLPAFSSGANQVCFYTGAGSSAPITPTTTAGVVTITVPAPAIQSIDPSGFTAANGYAIPALVSIVPAGATCDGTYDATLTNSFTIPIVEPIFAPYTGSTSIPQTNPSTNLQAPPTTILLAGSNFAANTTVAFDTYSNATSRVLSPTSISVTVPSSFAAQDPGATAALTVCNAGAATTTFCSTPATPIVLTVTPLYPSTAEITGTPSSATTADQVVLTATFRKGDPANPLPEPGAPSGTVAFSAASATIPPAKLILDNTATFISQTSTVTNPVAATPVLTPAAGSYLNSTTVSIADATPGSTIYYTQDGSTPTSASTIYTAPFPISTTQTVQAIAAAPGVLNSTVAAAAYTITVSPPTQLAFVVQPANTAINTPIAPAVQVAIQDASGNTVTTSTLPVSIALAANPAYSTLSGTTTVNAVNGIATFPDLSLNNISNRNTLLAYSGNLTSVNSAPFNVTPYPITMALQSALVGINSTLNGTVTLGNAAPQGGVTVTLASDTPANVTIAPSTLTIASGQTVGNFTYTGVAAGAATLSASATNYLAGTVTATATSAQVSLGSITDPPGVAPGQTISLALSLATPAPPGGTTVTFRSSNPGVATVTSSVFIAAGQSIPSANPQVTGIVLGATTITASAPGYAPATRAITVVIHPSVNPTTTNINLVTSTNTTLNILYPAQSGGLTFALTSDDPTIATVPASVTIPQGSTKVNLPITGVASGTTTIRAKASGVDEATGSVTVTSNITLYQTITGVLMERGQSAILPVAPSTPTTVTLTSSNPAIATLSTSSTGVGTASITFNNVTSTYVGTYYLQGQSQGNVTITQSATGYTTGTVTDYVYPSGFSIYYYQGDFSTTTYSSPTSTTVYTALYDPATNNLYDVSYALNPGVANISVPFTSSNTAVGTISTSPLVFHAGDSTQSTNFQPVNTSNGGTTTLAIGAVPAPFTQSNQYQQRIATVTTPAIIGNSVTTGVNLQTAFGISLPAMPPNPVTVTITTNGPGIATISNANTVVGTNTVTFTNVTSTYVGTIYVQGIGAGNTTLTISAPGYASGSSAITVLQSGFVINPYSSSFSINTTDYPPTIYVYTALLNADLSLYTYGYQLNPGVNPVTVPVSSSSTSIGTVTPTSLVFNPDDQAKPFVFQPVASGATTLSLGTPAGFSTPSVLQSITATVTNPNRAITIGNAVTTGVNLESSVGISLSTAPTIPLTVTVTTSSPSVATLSNTNTTVGTTTVTFTNVTSTYVGTLYIQGKGQGTTTITATATGYTAGSNTATVYPSGFGYSYYEGNFNTTTFSGPTNLGFYTQVLDPNSLNVVNYGLPLNPGISPVSLNVTSSAPAIGTISASPLIFNSGDTGKLTSFQPVAAGTSTISVDTPAGFSTPSNYTSLVATVSAPAISLNDVETGANLTNTLYVSLPQNPPNPVTITVTTNGPGIALISKTPTDVGSTTLTFTNVTSTNGFNIYVQGKALGATTITVSAPGYTNGNSNVTVDPAGFTFFYYQSSFNTSVGSNPTNLYIYPASLTPGTLTVINPNLFVNPGIGAVNVPVTSSNPLTGIITNSPTSFNGGDTAKTTSFQPIAPGTSTITLGTPTGFSSPSQYYQSTATVQ